MVECELECALRRDVIEAKLRDGLPLCFYGVVTRAYATRAGRDREREVRDADGVPSRIARGIPERTELLEPHASECGLLVELARRRVLQTLARIDEAAGQRP